MHNYSTLIAHNALICSHVITVQTRSALYADCGATTPCSVPRQVLNKILCLVAGNDKLGTRRNATKGPSSLFSLACVHPRLDKLLCKVSLRQLMDCI